KEAEIVRAMFEAYKETRSLREASIRLNRLGYRTKKFTSRTGRKHGGNKFSKYTVWQWLTNPAYIGKIRHNGEILPGRHPAIIEQKLWDEVHAILKDEAPGRNGRVVERKHNFLLEKLAFCGLCGSGMVPCYCRSKGERHFYYRCRAKYDGEKDCKLPVVRADELEGLVIAEVRKMGNGPEMARALEHAQALAKGQGKEFQDKLKGKQSEIVRLENEERNLLAFIKSAGLNAEDGKTPAAILEDLGSLRGRITKAREEIQEIEARLHSEGGSRIDPAAVRDSLNFFDTVFDLLSPAEKADLLKTFIQRVTYSLEKVQIQVYDEPLDQKTKEGLEGALLVPEPAGVSSGSLSRNKTLPD
ncbi:MAG: recombinase family protein, partial [Elusimicrobiota bacterium]